MRKIGKTQLTEGLNTNDGGAKTTAIQIDECDEVVVMTFANTGDNNTEVLECYGAGMLEDGSASAYFLIPSSTISQLSFVRIDVRDFAFFEVRVKTPEGGLSTTDVLVNPYIII